MKSGAVREKGVFPLRCQVVYATSCLAVSGSGVLSVVVSVVSVG